MAAADRAEKSWSTAKTGTYEEGIAYGLRGNAYSLAEEYPAAIEAYKRAVSLLRSVSTGSADLGRSLTDLANAEDDNGDLKAARQHFEEALRIAKKDDDDENVAVISGNLASLALREKDWAEAESLARKNLILTEKIGRQELVAEDCRRVAEALLRQRRKQEALAYAQRSVEIYRRLRSSHLKVARATLRACKA